MNRQHPPGPVNVLAGVGLTIRHAIAMWWDPIGYLTWLGHTYGDLAFVRVFTRRVYLLNGPAPIHDVLVAKEKHFRKFDRARHVLGTAFGNGLILSEGPDWLRQRRALYAAFHQPMMARYAHIMVARARQLIDEWRRQDRVELDHDMTRLALTIIGESLFSADLAPRSAHFARLAYELSTIYGAEEYNLFTLPDGFPLPSKRRKRAIVSEFHTLIRKLMAERRAASSHGDDLLTLLLDAIDRGEADGGMSEAQALDEAMTLFHGGYHSSSMGLAWLLFELTKHPQVVARVRAETDEVLAGRDATIADLPALRYTAMVVKEGLRLWPPAWEMFARENTADVELGGYRIAKGGIFLIHPFVTQRDPRFFPDPLRFDPQRFAAENDRAVSPFTYFPFGRGPHACIGATFASMEMTLVLATLVQHIQWRLAPGQPADVPPRPRMAIRPAAPIWIQPQARTDVAPAAADPIGASRS